LGSTGQKSVALLGFAKLSLDMEERNINTDRFKDELHRRIYAKETLGGRRVNFNFRFIDGNDFLENRSRKDLQRFIKYIQQPDQYYYEPLLVGINGCDKAETMRSTIVEAIGRDSFQVLPQKICLDYAQGPSGEPLETVVEVWLRVVVDDGA